MEGSPAAAVASRTWSRIGSLARRLSAKYRSTWVQCSSVILISRKSDRSSSIDFYDDAKSEVDVAAAGGAANTTSERRVPRCALAPAAATHHTICFSGCVGNGIVLHRVCDTL